MLLLLHSSALNPQLIPDLLSIDVDVKEILPVTTEGRTEMFLRGYTFLIVTPELTVPELLFVSPIDNFRRLLVGAFPTIR